MNRKDPHEKIIEINCIVCDAPWDNYKSELKIASNKD